MTLCIFRDMDIWCLPGKTRALTETGMGGKTNEMRGVHIKLMRFCPRGGSCQPCLSLSALLGTFEDNAQGLIWGWRQSVSGPWGHPAEHQSNPALSYIGPFHRHASLGRIN